jgi:hypothetical protein
MKHLVYKKGKNYLVIPGVGDPYLNFEISPKSVPEFKQEIRDIHNEMCWKLERDRNKEPFEIEWHGENAEKIKKEIENIKYFYY